MRPSAPHTQLLKEIFYSFADKNTKELDPTTFFKICKHYRIVKDLVPFESVKLILTKDERYWPEPRRMKASKSTIKEKPRKSASQSRRSESVKQEASDISDNFSLPEFISAFMKMAELSFPNLQDKRERKRKFWDGLTMHCASVQTPLSDASISYGEGKSGKVTPNRIGKKSLNLGIATGKGQRGLSFEPYKKKRNSMAVKLGKKIGRKEHSTISCASKTGKKLVNESVNSKTIQDIYQKQRDGVSIQTLVAKSKAYPKPFETFGKKIKKKKRLVKRGDQMIDLTHNDRYDEADLNFTSTNGSLPPLEQRSSKASSIINDSDYEGSSNRGHRRSSSKRKRKNRMGSQRNESMKNEL